jgi:hypothetical protein
MAFHMSETTEKYKHHYLKKNTLQTNVMQKNGSEA